MPHNLLYECENTIGTKTTYSKKTGDVSDSYEGICKGQAVAWVQNMLSGKAPKLTKPLYDKAAALQVLYERKKGGGNDGLFAIAGLTVLQNIQGNGHTLLGFVLGNPGVYQIRYDGHALAAANVNGKYYFFDSEQGLYEFDSALDFTAQFLKGYKSQKYREAWKFS